MLSLNIQFLMLLTSNYFILEHILYNSRVVDSCQVESCRKTGDAMCGLASNDSVGSPPGLCQWMGVSPIDLPKGTIPPGLLCSGYWLKQIDFACFLWATTLMRLIHQGPSLLAADSPASHGSGECLMRLMGSCYICCTPGLACSALSIGG